MPGSNRRHSATQLPGSTGIRAAASTFPKEGSVAMGQSDRVKVTLKWIQILDKLEPFYKERGEFRFDQRA